MDSCGFAKWGGGRRLGVIVIVIVIVFVFVRGGGRLLLLWIQRGRTANALMLRSLVVGVVVQRE